MILLSQPDSLWVRMRLKMQSAVHASFEDDDDSL